MMENVIAFREKHAVHHVVQRALAIRGVRTRVVRGDEHLRCWNALRKRLRGRNVKKVRVWGTKWRLGCVRNALGFQGERSNAAGVCSVRGGSDAAAFYPLAS